jgi:hypothetical protein
MRTATLCCLLLGGCMLKGSGNSDAGREIDGADSIDAAPPPYAPFLGVWQYQPASSVTDMCPAPSGTVVKPLRGNITIAPAVGGGDITVLDDQGCDVRYTVNGTTATGTAGLVCSGIPFSMTVTESITWTSITLSTTDGLSMNAASAGMDVFQTSSGMENCPFTGTATLVKVAK